MSALLDCRCNHPNCEDKTAYQMIGGCYNCGTKPILGFFTNGHEVTGLNAECPICGCTRLHWDRLAMESEIPVVSEEATA